MPSSRTSLAPHLRFRRSVLARDQKAGITNCPLCGTVLDYQVSRQPNSAEPDHIIAIANGGSNDPANGRAICRQCNQRRGSGKASRKPRPKVTASPGW